MNQEQLLDAAKKILDKVREKRDYWAGTKAEVCEFLRLCAGPKTSFYVMAEKAAGVKIQKHLATTMESYISFVTAGLYAEEVPGPVLVISLCRSATPVRASRIQN
ncbi:MAG: hypothetical protein LWX51_06570 [Deltaproteobacteria bacterium]|jgi:hypothetical protein|nr:hypothetical protein [Deltaproteobacteria bacterium]